MWLAYDGESVDNRYVLLANQYEHIYDSDGLSTLACLEFLTRRYSKYKGYIRVAFGFGYDVNMIVRDLPQDAIRQLMKSEPVDYFGYRLKYIPHKLFSIRAPNKRSCTIYDTFGFFQTRFTTVVQDWLGECPEIVTRGKASRETFAGFTTDDIIAYNHAECYLLARIMDKLRGYLLTVEPPIKINRWYGPGAVADWLLNRYGARWESMRTYPEKTSRHLWEAWDRSYFAGRIELLKIGGFDCPLYRYDLNSAYPWAAAHLWPVGPAWYRQAHWTGPAHPFSVWHVEWAIPDESNTLPGPFPHRAHDRSITFPQRGRGWYWYPEVKVALDRFGPRAIQIIEGYAHPAQRRARVAQALPAIYAARARMKREGNPAERVLKLGPNALYGKLAQRTGKRRWFCLPWAGYITSMTRAALYRAALQKPEAIVSFATDALVSTAPLDVPCSSLLGQWSAETFTGGTFLQSGVYRLRRADGHDKIYTRGFQLEDLKLDAAVQSIAQCGTAEVTIRRFVGWKLAQAAPHVYGPDVLTFKQLVKVLNPYDAKKRVYDWGVEYETTDGIRLIRDWNKDHVDSWMHHGGFAESAPFTELSAEQRFADDEADGDLLALLA